MALITLSVESQYLNGTTGVSIILPDKPRNLEPAQFYGSGRRYKVLWLLHGTYGDHTDWVRKSMIEMYAREKELLVVMPSALNSDYANWERCMMGYQMADFLTEELMPLVYHWLPASDRREDNFIAGLSMGGGGALNYALAHPDKFAAAAVLSSAVRNYERILADPQAAQDKRLANRLANYGGVEGFQNSNENTWRLLGERVRKGPTCRASILPAAATTACTSGITCSGIRAEIGAPITCEEIEGYAHEWRFWDLTIQQALDFFGLGPQKAGETF